jgi:cysteine-rich repeat protein
LNWVSCDTAATDTAIDQAHTTALAVAGSACRNGVDLTALGYASIIDMNIDIDIFCSDLEHAMESAVYGPALSHDVIQPPDPTTRACIETTSDETERLLQAGFRARRRAFDHIASNRFPVSRKFSIIAESTGQIGRAQQRLQTRLNADCPTFATIYPRSLIPYLTLVAERADCLSGRVYVQNFVTCPESVCGNGMQEPGERCDDGNTVSGDDCRADCQAITP